MKTRDVLRAYGLVIALGAGSAALATYELHASADTMWEVVRKHADSLVMIGRLKDASDRTGKVARMFLLTGDRRFLALVHESRDKLEAEFAVVSSRLEDPESRALLAQARAVHERHAVLGRELEAAADSHEPLASIATRMESNVAAHPEDSERLLDEIDHRESVAFEDAKRAALVSTNRRQHGVEIVAIIALAAAIALGTLLRRTLTLLQLSRDRLEEFNCSLEQINHDLDAFGGRVAHDLRNLLAPLGLAAASLDRGAARPEMVREIAARLQRLSRRADGLIDSLLAFSRAGRSPDEATPAAVPDVIRDVLEDLETTAASLSASVEVETEEVSVACGPNLLHAVLMNLVSNALKFLAGCPRREVRISVHRVGTRCEIAVADTGPGIPPDALPRLFTPFYRVPGTAVPGTGIGLATVHRILEAHGGAIDVKSVVERGSVFTATLPCAGELTATPA